jgi:hypothetical protein
MAESNVDSREGRTMIDSEFFKSLEEKFGPVAGIAAAAAIMLHIFGYLSLRFWLRSIGLTPDLGLVGEVYIFEGASMLLFLLTVLPLLVGTALAASALVWLARRLGPLRRGLAAVVTFFRTATAPWAAALGALWALLSVQLFLRHVLSYRDIVHNGVPCDPSWLPQVALTPGPFQAGFFALLLLIPLPTLWAVTWLARHAKWRPAAVLLGLMVIVQVLVIPVHYGVLISHEGLRRLDFQDAEPGTRVWELYRTEENVHLLVVDSATPPTRRLRSMPAEDVGTIDIVAVDGLFEILMEGRTCSPD